MKKALTISLAQTLFTIEDDAYAILDHYLQSVKTHFTSTSGQEEIIKDIEGRIAEQFLESGKNIITLTEVNSVIASMGAADQFGDTNDNAPKVENVANAKKKLYRNPDDAIIAGVCSGLAAYFDTSVVGVRVIFFVLAMMNGFGVLLYVLLWIITPAAKTASQKLEMSGSPVTLATLSESVKERVEEAAEKAGPTFKKVLSAPFTVIGIVLRTIVTKVFPFFRVLFGVVLAVVSFFAMVMLSFFATLALTGNLAKYADFPIVEVLTANTFYLVVVAGYLVVVIPALFIFLSGAALIRKKNVMNAGWGFGLLGIWCVALVAAGAMGFEAGTRVYEYQLTDPAYQNIEKQIVLSENKISEVQVDSGYRLSLIQSTSTQKILIKAKAKDADKVVVKEVDGILQLSRAETKMFCLFCDHDTVELIVSLPTVEKIAASEGSRVVLKDWQNVDTLNVSLAFGARADMDVIVKELRAELKDGARLTLTGSAVTSTFTGTFGSRVEAQDFVVENVTATVNYGARMFVHATKTLSAIAEQGGRIDYTGDAVVTKKIKDGGRVKSVWLEEPKEIEEPELIEPIQPIE